MAFLKEGFTITYIGPDADGLVLGDKGTLLAFASNDTEPDDYAHCLWHTGIRTGQPTLVRIGDIDNASKKYQQAHHDDLADSLDVGPIQTVGAKQVHASGGVDGVLVYLSTEGALANLPRYTEEALSLVASKIRSDQVIMSHLGALDVDEQEEIIAQAALRSLGNAFGGN